MLDLRSGRITVLNAEWDSRAESWAESRVGSEGQNYEETYRAESLPAVFIISSGIGINLSLKLKATAESPMGGEGGKGKVKWR